MTVKLTRTAVAVASALVMLSPAGLAATGGGAAWAQNWVHPETIAPCMWNAAPAAARNRFLALPDLDSAIDGAAMIIESDADLSSILDRCGVPDRNTPDAGELFGAYSLWMWVEGKLSGRWSAATLDGAYGRLSEADLAALDGDDENAAAGPALERFKTDLGAGQIDADTVILLRAYVLARIFYALELDLFGS